MNSQSRVAGTCCVLLALMLAPISAQQKPAADQYDEQLARYLESARQQVAVPAAGRSDWMNGLMGDVRASRINDLVTIRVVESITATGTADSTLSKSSNGSASVPSLFGLESKLPPCLRFAAQESKRRAPETDCGGAASRMVRPAV